MFTTVAAPSLDSIMLYEHPQLLRRLEKKVGMDAASARAAFDDTKRFLYVCAVTDEPLAPTEQIDEVWHNFVLYTQDYAAFCEDHFGFMIQHRPWSKDDLAACDGTVFRRTREIAERLLGGNLSGNWEYGQTLTHPDEFTCSCRSCFPAGSEVLLPDGKTKPIEQVTVGDLVMGFDGVNAVPVRVKALESPVRDHYYQLTFADGSTIRLTREHPVFTAQGWKALAPESTARENPTLTVETLQVGDEVFTANGAYRTLVGISLRAGQVQTYNLKALSEFNTFFVNGFMVHTKATEPTHSQNQPSSQTALTN